MNYGCPAISAVSQHATNYITLLSKIRTFQFAAAALLFALS